jgi:hypothetical protein
MKATLLTKAALCVCPPALLATAAAVEPHTRKAVHHATRPHQQAKPATKSRALAPRRTPVARAVPCAPTSDLTSPPDTLTTLASAPPVLADGIAPVPGSVGPSPVSTSPLPGGGPIFGGGPGTPGTPGTPGNPGTDTPGENPGTPVNPPPEEPIAAVPEPSTWAMMIAGFGVVGWAIRRQHRLTRRTRGRRGRRVRAGGAGALGAVWTSGDVMVAGAEATAAGAKGSALLAKALMCVCPPAIVATTAVAVPPVRQAVYAATAPKPTRPSAAAPAAVPCDPKLSPAVSTSEIDKIAPAMPKAEASGEAVASLPEAVRV